MCYKVTENMIKLLAIHATLSMPWSSSCHNLVPRDLLLFHTTRANLPQQTPHSPSCHKQVTATSSVAGLPYLQKPGRGTISHR